VSKAEGLPSVVVAWCDLAAPDAGTLLTSHASVSIVRGIRHKPAAASGPTEAKRGAAGSMDDPAWRQGYAMLERHGLSFDLQTPWWHLDAAADLAKDFPATQIIINHTGLPADRSPEALAAWRHALERAAAQPNVALKISGLGLPGRPWTVATNGPVIRDALAIFGLDRTMFASNFPVDSLVGDFDTIFSGFLAATASLPGSDRDRLFHDNARRIYRL
jgi:predicted TIM-barrel fold metal-dependent hydrolase